MNIAYEIKKWDMTHPLWLTISRIMLGICLVIKGIYFLNNPLLLQSMIQGTTLGSLNFNVAIAMVITWLHILGGTFITLGLFTRISIIPQIPVLLGAIIFVNTRQGFSGGYADLLFSVFILLLLVFFLFEGPGKTSMDNYLKKYLL